MQQKLSRWQQGILVVGQVIGGIALVVMMLQVTLNALLRKVFDTQVGFTLELSQWWYMPALACCGIVLAAIGREHFEVEVLFEVLSETEQRLVTAFALLLTGVLTAAITLFSLQEALDLLEIGKYEPVTGLPVWPVSFLIPVAFGVYTVVVLAQLYAQTFRPKSRLVEQVPATLGARGER